MSITFIFEDDEEPDLSEGNTSLPNDIIEICENIYPADGAPNLFTATEYMQCNCKNSVCDDDCLNRATFTECYRCSNERCTNQNIRLNRFSPRYRISHMANGKGYGVILLHDITAGAPIGQYLGEIITATELSVRKRRIYKEALQMNCLPRYYFIQLNKGWFIDSKVYGNAMRFVNHSCNPNTMILKWDIPFEHANPGLCYYTQALVLTAKRHIKSGEELTFNYNLSYAKGDKKEICLCNTPSCKGFF